jgi:hypothetical protein
MTARIISFVILFSVVQNINAQPVNDNCSAAIMLSCGSSIIDASTVNSSNNGDALGCSTGIGVWYKITPTVSETYELIISNPTFFYQIAFVQGLNCDSFETILCQNGSSSSERTFYFYGEANKEYYVYIGDNDDNGTQNGTFDILLNCLTPPANVVCNSARALSCGSNLIAESSVGSVDSADDLGCDSGIGIWYTFIPSSTQTIELFIDNSTFLYDITLAEGSSCGNLTKQSWVKSIIST